MSQTSLCFPGVRIVELAQFVFVPGAGALLADMGAEVIKIEEPVKGDPYRSLVINDGRQTGSANLAMEMNNRGKRSIAIDLKSAEGREIFLRLIATADVFLTSIRPKAIERLGLGLQALRAVNPKLIYVHGNGLGFKGPHADRAGFDASCFWARGGFGHVLRPNDSSPPVRPRPALGDHTGATNIAMGVAAALFRRERTGEPSLIEVSLLSTAAWTLSADIVTAQVPGYSEQTLYDREFEQPLCRAYCASDGRWVQLMFIDPERYWRELCTRIGAPELVDVPAYGSVALRAANGVALAGDLDIIFARRTGAEWDEAFANWDAPWEFIASIKEVREDPQAIANDHLFEITVEDGTRVELVSNPVAVDGSRLPVNIRRAPHKGEDTFSILGEIGIAESELERLRDAGTIA